MPKRGQQMLYRPVPDDFPDVFVRVGWLGIEQHYRAHAKTIKRWLQMCGEEALKEQRARYVAEHGYHARRRRQMMLEG